MFFGQRRKVQDSGHSHPYQPDLRSAGLGNDDDKDNHRAEQRR